MIGNCAGVDPNDWAVCNVCGGRMRPLWGVERFDYNECVFDIPTKSYKCIDCGNRIYMKDEITYIEDELAQRYKKQVG